MDISSDSMNLIAGYENGEIIIWDIETANNIRQISGVLESAIMCVKFWKNDKDHLLASDASGNVYLFTIKKLFWTYSVDK